MSIRFRFVLLFAFGVAVIIIYTGYPNSSRLNTNILVTDVEKNVVKTRDSSSVAIRDENENESRLENATNTSSETNSTQSLAENRKILKFITDPTDVESIDDLYFSNIESVKRRVMERMENMKEQLRNCKKKALIPLTKIPLYQINEKGMSWCPVFKSGSTTWKKYFIDTLVPNHKSYNLNELDRRKLRIGYRDRSKKYADKSTNLLYYEKQGNERFTIVRHPLSRLISHTQNAAKDHEMVAMEKEWISKAIIDNRQKLIKSNQDRSKFEKEFREYFIWLKDRRRGNFHITKGNVFLEPPYPLIDDLVSYIIRTDAKNGHWAPAWSWCKMCEIAYHYVIKLEEEPLELWYLLEQLGLWEDRQLFLRKTNNSQNPGNVSKTEREIFEENLKRLNDKQRNWVNKYFQNDFKFFGYEKLKSVSGDKDSKLESGSVVDSEHNTFL